MASSVKTTVQSEVPSESHVSESACLAPRHHSESLESFSEQVADRIKAPQNPHLEDSMSQGGPFLNSGANSTRWSAQSLLPQT